MAEWIARVEFPDGTQLFTRYSTVTMDVSGELYRHATAVSEALEDGQTGYRAAVRGEPLPHQRGKLAIVVDRLVPVLVTSASDGATWHSLFSLDRGMLLGPLSPCNVTMLQDEFHLVETRDGQLHLRRWDEAGRDLLCGAADPGQEIAFSISEYPGKPPTDEPARRDLYAEWQDGRVCRRCLTHPAALGCDT